MAWPVTSLLPRWERRGARAVFAGRFVAAVHTVLPIVAGTVRMRFRRFLAACVVGALTWSALYLTSGRWPVRPIAP